ncbi:MAG: Hpt domain-containing protein, partial [Thermodesulfobacteriota bacterium]
MDDKLLQIFAEESQELIDSLERGLLQLEGSEAPEEINSVFRAAHTMKGNAGIVGFEDVVELTHLMEGLLDEMRQGRCAPDAEVVGLLLGAVDALKVLVQGRLGGQRPEPPREMLAMLARRLGEEPAAASSGPAGAATAGQPQGDRLYHIVLRLQPQVLDSGTDPLQILLELSDLGRLERVLCHAEGLPELGELKPDRLYLWWEIWLASPADQETVEDVFIFLRDENDIRVQPAAAPPPADQPQPRPATAQPAAASGAKVSQPQPTPAAPASAAPHASAPASPGDRALVPVAKAAAQSATIRVETDKLDKLVNLVGELV